MIVKKASPGQLGFDVNTPLTTAECEQFASSYSFVIRYIPRTASLVAGNLTKEEIEIILASGMALSVVQHVSPDGWHPSAALGTEYGQYAEYYASELGLPPGMQMWLDLEGVAAGAMSGDIVAYCHNWAHAVSLKGYLHGLYVGWNTRLTPGQIYDLPFDSYWKAYNYDDGVPRRGFQMVQGLQKTLGGISFDPDKIQADQLGDLPFLLFP